LFYTKIKTMLKTQFTRAFYLCNSFLLFAVPFTADPVNNLSASSREENYVLKTSLNGTLNNSNGNISLVRMNILKNKSSQFNFGKPQILLNKNEMLFARKYIKNSGDCLVGVKKRSLIPFNIIDSVFNRYGLPVELKYLAVIESELKPMALSRVGARGPWQMMPATARILGLKTTYQCDERTNYYKSTIAAARYLKDLYALFDDWLLVLAAYNGGPGPVYSAIRESGSKNFWILQNYLPTESRDHVKKFIATHYYFEGRGSETTLTKAENIKYKIMVNSFVKANFAPKVSVKQKIKSETTCKYRQYPAIHYEVKQPIGFVVFGINDDFQKYLNISRQNESSGEKFKRIMKESEECLKKSGKII
jgi:membrane-bound lytic murein transglycosylase D